jgi:predicted Rossmann fold flavoprotein
VIIALLSTAALGNVEIETRSEVSSVRKTGDRFELQIADGRREVCNKLLVATGGGAFVEEFGHTIEPCVPSLFSFTTSDKEFTALAGIVEEDVLVRAAGLRADGALLITHGGVSGPAVLRLSSFGARRLAEMNYRFEMKINWRPSMSEEQVFQTLEKFRTASPRKQIGTWSPVGLSSRLWKLLVARAGVDETVDWGNLSLKALRHLAAQVSEFTLSITGKNRHREEFVTCGGVRLKEVSFQTMESRLVAGLYFAGEVLDIDALTGGFNLQAAWTTGCLAARSLSCGKRL